MAGSRRLSEGWMLSDGVFAPFAVDHPADVPSALRAHGLTVAAPAGVQFLHEEWIYQHTFTYSLRFALPDDGDEWHSLYFERLLGQGFILLNGEIIWCFDDSSAHVPLTGNHLRDGENLLQVQFIPPCERAVFGITGGVFLRSGNALMLSSVRIGASGSTITSDVNLECFSQGKYLFRYSVSLDGAPVKQYEFIERLPAITPASLSHELVVPSPVRWDAARPDETGYMIKLSVERGAVGCELVHARAALLPNGYRPLRVVRLPDVPTEALLTAIRALGAEAVYAPDEPDESGEVALRLPEYLQYGLLTVSNAPAPLPAERAILPYEQLEALAGDLPLWPSDAPIWKMLGAEPVDRDEYERLFGVNAAGDARRCIGYSRTLQADRLREAAAARLQAGQPALINVLNDLFPTPMSPALLDMDGAERPGYRALQSIWTSTQY